MNVLRMKVSENSWDILCKKILLQIWKNNSFWSKEMFINVGDIFKRSNIMLNTQFHENCEIFFKSVVFEKTCISFADDINYFKKLTNFEKETTHLDHFV